MEKWLKYKRYPHLDLPIEPKSKRKLIRYVICPQAIATHAFLPLIRRNLVSRPYKIVQNSQGITIHRPKKKIREITYASHIDAAIYSYYGYILQKKHEFFLEQTHLQDIVAAYRKIPREDGRGNKCNIEIAHDVFEFIKSKLCQEEEVVVITFDIKGFFDNLDHKLIKFTWKQMLGCDKMTDDVYAVYKSITSYSYIFEEELFERFKEQIVCETPSGLKRKKVKRLIYMRDKKAVAFCDQSAINELRKAKKIRTRPKSLKGKKGIPQGLPISAILANVYMCNFDKEIASDIESFRGLYRRYSDDIIIVCPQSYGQFWKDWMKMCIKRVHLDIESSKTNLYTFSRVNNRIICKHETQGENKKLEYLGFSFDGNRTLIKNSGLGHYYYRISKAIARSKIMAIKINNSTNGRIFENQLIKRFSYAGAKTNKIRKRSQSNHSKFILDKKRKSHGNFITYIRKASSVMNEPAIIRQIKRNKNKLKEQLIKLHLDIGNI